MVTVDYDPLCRWVVLREEARRRKDGRGPRPWTEDPIISRYRFCNVRREDDLVTRWIKDHVRDPYRDHPSLWLMLCVCRVINWPDTLAEMIAAGAWPGLPGWIDRAYDVLSERRRRGEKVYTGAYVIPAPSERGADKQAFVCRTMLGSLDQHCDELSSGRWEGREMGEVHRWIRLRGRSWGNFLAYQAVVDMRFCERLLASAPDREIWAAAGPGTVRGLHRLRGRALGASLPQEQALRELREVYDEVPRRSGVDMDFSDAPNILCEFDKYERARLNEGRPRATYVPGRGC